MLLYCVVQVVRALAIGNSFSWLLCPLVIHLPPCVHVIYFLLSGSAGCSRLILYVLPQFYHLPFLQGALILFLGKGVRKSRSHVIVATAMPSLLGAFSSQGKVLCY